jgi:hypothetical protein
MHVLIEPVVSELKKGNSHNLIINKITNVKDLSKSENPSFSNKTKFRLMDILDLYKK